MSNSVNNNNNVNLQQLIDKVKAMLTPEKRAEMMVKVKSIWAVINEKPAEAKIDLKAKLAIQETIEARKSVNSKLNVEIKP